jgi:hypothetical protein
MKVYWGSGSIAPHVLDLGTRWRWVVSFTSRPLYPQGKNPWYPLNRRLGGPQSRSGRGGEEKNSQPLPGLEPSDHPTWSPAVMPLSDPGSWVWGRARCKQLFTVEINSLLRNVTQDLGWENIRNGFWRIGVGRWILDSFGSGLGPVVGSYEHGTHWIGAGLQAGRSRF